MATEVSQILDVVEFLRAARARDGLAMNTLTQDGNAREMLIGLAGLLIADVPNLGDVLDGWQEKAMDVAVRELPTRDWG